MDKDKESISSGFWGKNPRTSGENIQTTAKRCKKGKNASKKVNYEFKKVKL